MLRHVALFRWSPETTAEHIAALREALNRLPAAIPEIRDYRFGPDVGINQGTADFAVVADFANPEDYLVYRDHAAHQAVLADHLAPHLAERIVIQYEC